MIRAGTVEHEQNHAGVPAIRLHDARQSAASISLRAKVPTKVVSERLRPATSKSRCPSTPTLRPKMTGGAVDSIDAAALSEA
jgi:hypothetical protein